MDAADQGPLAFSGEQLVVLSLLTLAACCADLPLHVRSEEDQAKRGSVEARLLALHHLTRHVSGRQGLDSVFEAEGLYARRQELHRALVKLPRGAIVDVADRMALELVSTSPWPDKCKWSGNKHKPISEAVTVVEAGMAPDKVAALEKAYKSSSSRLARASVATSTKVLLGVGSIVVTAASAGVAAPAIGTAIGGAMGLSGAAATSAGLAALGGGSLAAGGFGMAGGVLLVKVAAGLTYKGSKYVATSIAASSRAAFIHEMAKLHVATRLVERTDADARDGVLRHLASLDEDLASTFVQVEREVRDLKLQQARSRTSAVADSTQGLRRSVVDWVLVVGSSRPRGKRSWRPAGRSMQAWPRKESRRLVRRTL